MLGAHIPLDQKYSKIPTLHTNDTIFAVEKWKGFFHNFVLKLFDLKSNIYNLSSLFPYLIISMPSRALFALIHNDTFVESQVHVYARVYFPSVTFVCGNTTAPPATHSFSSVKLSSLFWVIYYSI